MLKKLLGDPWKMRINLHARALLSLAFLAWRLAWIVAPKPKDDRSWAGRLWWRVFCKIASIVDLIDTWFMFYAIPNKEN